MIRLVAAALVVAACWLAFTVGGAWLLARQLGRRTNVPVAVRRLGLDVARGAIVLHDVRAGRFRASAIRMPPATVVGLWRSTPLILRDVTLERVRVGGPGAPARARAVEVDRLIADADTVRFAGRILDRDGRMAVRGRRRNGRLRLAAALRGVDARTIAPLITAATLRGGRIDGRVHVADTLVHGDLHGRGLTVDGRSTHAHAARVGLDHLVLDLATGRTRARRAAIVGGTVRRDGVPPLRRIDALARWADAADATGHVALRAELRGGRLRARGTVELPWRALDAEVKADRVGLASLLPAGAGEFTVADGRLGARFRIAGPPWAAADVRIALDHVRVVETAAPEAGIVLACERAEATAERVDAQPLRARLRRASLDGLALRVRREADGLWPATRIAALAASPIVQALLATPPEGSGASELPAFEVSWTGGTVAFEDRVLDPPGRVQVRDLAGELHQNAGAPPRRLAGAIGGGLFTGSFAAGFAAEGPHWRVEIDVDTLDASLLAPWLRPVLHVGAAGTVSAHSEIDWDGREFTAPSRLTAEALVVDDRPEGPHVLGLSLARALALAGDGAGLTVTLPVSGATDDVGAALAKALADGLAPIITAPVAAVTEGRPVVVPFPGGSEMLDDAAADVVDRVATLLHHRPALAVTVTGRTAPDDGTRDPVALARARANRVRERLCNERGVPDERVRTRTSARKGPPAALVEARS